MEYSFQEVACNICGQDNASVLGFRGGEAHRQNAGVKCRIVQCRRCRLIYPNPMPMPVQSLDEHYHDPEDYFQHHDVDTKLQAGRGLLRTIEQRLKHEHPAGGSMSKGRLLDIGSGRGELLAAARELGWEAEGVDVARAFAEAAQRRFGVTVHVGKLEDLCLPNQAFDAITMGGLLEHVYDPKRLLMEVARLLKPGGVLWLDVPNEAGLHFRFGNLYMRLRGKNWVVNLAPTFSPFHIYGFTPHSIRELLQRTGFSGVELTMYGGNSLLPSRGSTLDWIETSASVLVHKLSWLGLGNYMEVWARRAAA